MNLGNKVKTRREELGFSQEELAFKMGYKSRTSINKIENGRDVSQKIIVKLAEVLQTSPAYLMGWEDQEKEKPTAEDGLSENIKALIDFAKTVPEDKAELVLKLMRTIVEDE